MKSSLIISTYNWSEALDLVLESLSNQSVLPDEVIIADDGSGEGTHTLINNFKLPLKHIWHEDNGFRKAKILNKAIASAKGDYIIQIDGDCIMHPSFVADHISFSQEGCYLFGSRVNIQKAHLPSLFSNRDINFNLFSKGIKKRTRAIHFPFLGQFYREKEVFSKKFRGCNTSYFKSDFIEINGYDENFEGWGREDSELALRFHNFGLKAKRLRYQGIIYHIYHNEKSKDRLEQNDSIEKMTIKTKRIKTDKGISQYL